MGDKVMARYVCKRQDQDKAREGLVPPDGIGGLSEVVVAVDVPRYARRDDPAGLWAQAAA